jgi:LCP family protein required for cell wall assembly
LWGVAGKVGYALSCVAAAVVLAVSGFSYFVVRDVSSIGGSHAILSGPSIGAQNILLMGLESRTDWNGNVLPNDVLRALHAGSRQGILTQGVGGNTTNTLILIHIPAGGKKAVGFSIPRDDWVTFPAAYDAQSQGKVDQAYGLALAAKESEVRTQNPHTSQNQVAFAGNEAGRAAAVATVEQLTGVHIDHFAEMNLDGFYELARVLGGVNVCLRHPVAYDSFSGFWSHRAGYQHLNAQMALAFVRQRHGLLNGDLDRTHRQQAFLDSVIQELRTQGVLGDLTKINALLSVAKQYVITDAGWNLLDFITQMRSLSTGSLAFRTLPVVTTDGHMGGQDVNLIDPPYIQQVVRDAFYPSTGTAAGGRSPARTPPAAPASSVTVDVYNGGYTAGLAREVSDGLVSAGYLRGQVATATTHPAVTEVLYGTGASGNAARIASAFGVTAQASTSVTAGHVQIMLGTGATLPNFGSLPSSAGSSSPGASPSSPSPTPSASSSSSSDDGQAGGIVSAMKNSSHGIPCVN